MSELSGAKGGSAAGKSLDDMVQAARLAQANAWAPYSGFRVGAALLATDGSRYVGCNVENASYPAGVCAERGALVAAIAAGARTFSQIVIVSDARDPSPPCGICRQALVEFTPNLEVVSVSAGGDSMSWSLSDLLPVPFSPSSLAHA